MRGKSHTELGRYLIRNYMPHHPQIYTHAFLCGCIEPDRNPLTYLKGSMRFQWLRGHNYPNTFRFLCRMARRLEGRKTLSLADYYTLGKLIHYTADAFTFAHNEGFPSSISAHRIYEAQLQTCFLRYLSSDPHIEIPLPVSIMDGFIHSHQAYLQESSGVRTDCIYTVMACHSVFFLLKSRQLL